MNFQVQYLGNLSCQSTHIKSGTTIITDAPVDNKGKGSTFSPTDLASVSLANCMMTIVGIAADERGISLVSMRADVTKEMASNPRRIAAIRIQLFISGNFTEKEKTILRNSALTCPVALSLHPDLEQDITVIFES
jgi:uncharacterized OsmC-like protein